DRKRGRVDRDARRFIIGDVKRHIRRIRDNGIFGGGAACVARDRRRTGLRTIGNQIVGSGNRNRLRRVPVARVKRKVRRSNRTFGGIRAGKIEKHGSGGQGRQPDGKSS